MRHVRFYTALVVVCAWFTLAMWLAWPAHAAGQCGVASWYGPGFHGRLTASGERFDQNAMTAAHRSLPFGTIVTVTWGDRAVVVRVKARVATSEE